MIQGKLGITRSLGPLNFVCYIRYLVVSVVNKQYKTEQFISFTSLGLEKIVVISGILSYIRSLYIEFALYLT